MLGNDTDADGDPLTATGATQPAHGKVTLNANGSFTYTPAAGFFGTDTFTYKANDGTVDSAPATVTITVAEDVDPNRAPIAAADVYSTEQGKALTIAAPGVLANDTDADSDPLAATGLTQPANGVVTLSANGAFTYTPEAGFSGKDRFTYTAYDGKVGSAPTTVTITVVNLNDVPVAVGDVYITDEDKALTVAAPGLLGNDTDADGDPLTATGLVQPAHGRVTLSANGSFTYTPDAGFSGTDTFRYAATDGKVSSVPATVTISVNDVAVPATPTLIMGSGATLTYGEVRAVSATISPASAAGRVEVLAGSRVLASGNLSAGRVVLALPARSLLPGTHLLTLRYAGSATHEASATAVLVTVKKVTPTMQVKAPKKVKLGKQANVRVKLSAANGVAVNGLVKVTLKGGETILRRVDNGSVELKLPKATETGILKVKVVYLGSGLATKVVRTLTITVKG